MPASAVNCTRRSHNPRGTCQIVHLYVGLEVIRKAGNYGAVIKYREIVPVLHQNRHPLSNRKGLTTPQTILKIVSRPIEKTQGAPMIFAHRLRQQHQKASTVATAGCSAKYNQFEGLIQRAVNDAALDPNNAGSATKPASLTHGLTVHESIIHLVKDVKE
jgi:hypothetical protein